MAKLANLTDFFSTASTKPKASRASGKVKPTMKERTIQQLRQEYEDFTSGKKYDSPRKASNAWIQDHDGEIRVAVKAGNMKLDHGGSDYLYTDSKKLDRGIKTLIAHLEAGSYDSQIETISKGYEERGLKRKK